MRIESATTGRRSIARIIALVLLSFAAVLLLPRCERYVLKRACTIAYVTEGERIHLTNETGTIDVELEGPEAAGRVGRPYAPPAWSPGGEYVGYQCLNAWDGTSHVAVLRPWSGERWVHASQRGDRFLGWVDEETWVDGRRARDARTGTVVAELSGEVAGPRVGGSYEAQVVPADPGQAFRDAVFCDWTEEGKMLANVREAAGWALVLLDKDGKLMRRIETEARPMPETAASWRRTARREEP